jgi:hypothetical protein
MEYEWSDSLLILPVNTGTSQIYQRRNGSIDFRFGDPKEKHGV